MSENGYVKRDYKQELTDKLVKRIEAAKAGLESGLQLSSPWLECASPPVNPVTGTRYRGINFISCMSAGYSDPRFLTYKNVELLAKEMGQPIHVKKGEVGIPIFKAVQIEVGGKGKQGEEIAGKEGSHGESEGKKMVWTLAYAGTVFNAEQISGIEPLQPRAFEFEPLESAEQLVDAMREKTSLQVEHIARASASYSSKSHAIKISNPEMFVSREAYYDVLLHELGHSTGPALGRDMGNSFGSQKYAFEELVAELSSVFMGAELGVKHSLTSMENHAGYLDSWLRALKEDKNIIFKAAALASKASQYQVDTLNDYRLEHGLSKSAVAQVCSREEAIQLIAQNPDRFKDVPDTFRLDKGFVMEAIQVMRDKPTFPILSVLDGALRDDKEVVLSAISKDSDSKALIGGKLLKELFMATPGNAWADVAKNPVPLLEGLVAQSCLQKSQEVAIGM